MKNDLGPAKTLHSDFYATKKLYHDKCGFEITELHAEDESQEYGACQYTLNGNSIKFRVSKITPTKSGQFVTIWKRNTLGVTAPFDFSDEIDFLVITARNANKFGLFIFPKSVLVDKRIITKNNNTGKRGIRVYAPWDVVTSQQAEKTQRWQTNHFLTIKNDDSTDPDLVKSFFEKS